MIFLMPLTNVDETAHSALSGCRILLVEDDYLVGLSIRGMLERIGCQVFGPVATVEQARELIEQQQLDVGVLDINIVGGTSVPIAEMLQTRHRPFLFVSGYQSPSHLLPEMLRETKRLSKPVDERSLALAINDVMM